MTQNFAQKLRQEAVQAHQSEDLAKAEELYRRYLQLNPSDGALWSNLGALYRKEKQYELAALAQHRAMEHSGDQKGTINNAANAFFDNGDVERALELRLKLQELEPDNPDHWAYGAKCLRGLRRYKEAQEMCEERLRENPNHVELHLQLALACLSQGNYARGFQEFDWRWSGDELTLPKYDIPRWEGQDLKGKSIMVLPEQGFGDTILIARFLPALKKAGATVSIVCKKPLLRVFEDLDGVDQFNPKTSDLGKFDYWTPFLDMPRYVKTTYPDIPAPTVLSIPKDSADRATARIKPNINSFNLGVLWSGSITYRANHKRSFSHSQFLSLADIEGLQMYSLYKGPLLDTFLRDGSSSFIVNAGGEDRDFADSAALIKELDLVITMDSAIAHVSGSLGVPVWNLLHDNPYWLYEPEEDSTPWYPSMRLVRQKYGESWDEVFKRVRADLEPLVAKKRE